MRFCPHQDITTTPASPAPLHIALLPICYSLTKPAPLVLTLAPGRATLIFQPDAAARHASQGGLQPQDLMKQTVRMIGGLNELFGTLDENLKLFESTLHVTTQLRDHDLEIEGAPEQVERAARILGDYNDRLREGRVPDSQEVKALLKSPPPSRSRNCAALFLPPARAPSARKAVTPKSANQRRYIEATRNLSTWFLPSARAERVRPISRSPWPSRRCSRSR